MTFTLDSSDAGAPEDLTNTHLTKTSLQIKEKITCRALPSKLPAICHDMCPDQADLDEQLPLWVVPSCDGVVQVLCGVAVVAATHHNSLVLQQILHTCRCRGTLLSLAD
jgi:hypothetical protein